MPKQPEEQQEGPGGDRRLASVRGREKKAWEAFQAALDALGQQDEKDKPRARERLSQAIEKYKEAHEQRGKAERGTNG